MVTPRALVGIGAVTATGQVTWRGATYATSTTGYGTGDLVLVLLQDGALTILGRAGAPAGGGGAFLPLAGGTLTGPLYLETGHATYRDGWLAGSSSADGINLEAWLPALDGSASTFPHLRMTNAMVGGVPEAMSRWFSLVTFHQDIVVAPFMGATKATWDAQTGNLDTVGTITAAGAPADSRDAVLNRAAGDARWVRASPAGARIIHAQTAALTIPGGSPTGTVTLALPAGLFTGRPVVTVTPLGGVDYAWGVDTAWASDTLTLRWRYLPGGNAPAGTTYVNIHAVGAATVPARLPAGVAP